MSWRNPVRATTASRCERSATSAPSTRRRRATSGRSADRRRRARRSSGRHRPAPAGTRRSRSRPTSRARRSSARSTPRRSRSARRRSRCRTCRTARTRSASGRPPAASRARPRAIRGPSTRVAPSTTITSAPADPSNDPEPTFAVHQRTGRDVRVPARRRRLEHLHPDRPAARRRPHVLGPRDGRRRQHRPSSRPQLDRRHARAADDDRRRPDRLDARCDADLRVLLRARRALRVPRRHGCVRLMQLAAHHSRAVEWRARVRGPRNRRRR